jgi:hypothetical protein
MSPIFAAPGSVPFTSSSGPSTSFHDRIWETLVAPPLQFLLKGSKYAANPTPHSALDKLLDYEDELAALSEELASGDSDYDEELEEDGDSEDGEDDEDDEDDEELEDDEEELILEEELADLREVVTLEDFAGAEDSGFEDPIAYLSSLEQASIFLEEHKRLHRSPRSTTLYPAPMGFDPRFGPAQCTSNLPASLMSPFSHPNFIDPIRPARPEYICPRAGCPIKSNHRTGKFSQADTDRPFRICFLELNLRNVSLTFDEFMVVHAFYAAHEKPLRSQDKGKSAEPRRVYQPPTTESDSESGEQLEAEQDEEDACAGAQEVKAKGPEREVRIAEATSSIDRLIDARIEKLLADRAKQANGDRSKILLDLLMGPARKA